MVSPFGIFGGRNRGYGPGWGRGYDPRYGRGYGGGYGGYGGGYGRRGPGGGGCLRDLLLLEGGCCLAEALGGSCLLHAGWLLPAMVHALTTPSGTRRGAGSRRGAGASSESGVCANGAESGVVQDGAESRGNAKVDVGGGARSGTGADGGSRSQRVLLSMIGSYQRNVSARRSRPVCRFTPSCSAYAAEAVTTYGARSGTRMAMGRLLRCRPGTRGGFDPVGGHAAHGTDHAHDGPRAGAAR